eukprot:Skav217765  [mRNA]  locus=scaffold1912:70311:80021:- [translate_table: standard]
MNDSIRSLAEQPRSVDGAFAMDRWVREIWKVMSELSRAMEISFLSAPVPQVYALHAMPSRLKLVNPSSILSLHANCAAQVIYGLYRPVPAAVPANLFGLVASVYYLGTCWLRCSNRTTTALPRGTQKFSDRNEALQRMLVLHRLAP